MVTLRNKWVFGRTETNRAFRHSQLFIDQAVKVNQFYTLYIITIENKKMFIVNDKIIILDIYYFNND